jgi:hypothetical protein
MRSQRLCIKKTESGQDLFFYVVKNPAKIRPSGRFFFLGGGDVSGAQISPAKSTYVKVN